MRLREQCALECGVPAAAELLALVYIYCWLVALGQLPAGSERFTVGPDADGESREQGSAECSGFMDNGYIDSHIEDVCLELHEKAIDGSATIRPQFREANACLLAHCINYISGLVGDAFERGTNDVRAGGAARESTD